MHPILFQIGDVTVYTHGLLALAGIVFGAYTTYLLAKKSKLSTELLFDNVIYITLIGIVGARLAYYLLYPNQFESARDFFYLWNGGMVSYGGFIAGGVALYLILRSQKQHVLKWLDAFTPGFFLGLALGRVGNLMAGEYSGVARSAFPSINGVFPATTVEAVLCLLIFAIGIIYYYKNINKSGLIFLISLMVYGAGRFAIDILRAEPKIFYSLSPGQVADVAVFLAGTVALVAIYRKAKK